MVRHSRINRPLQWGIIAPPFSLPRADDAPDTLPLLDLRVAPETIAHPHARDIIEKLQALRRQVNATTPHALLSQAVDMLRVRPILLRRHRGQAERALANVDLYLGFSRDYAVRGLRAFAEAMTAAWSDEARAVEGRPDAQEEAVALYTMHAAKGLEWPIVVPINTMTRVMAPDSAVTDRANGRFYCRVFGAEPTGYARARDDEGAELDRERVLLWYVATTRARELLVLPRLDVDPRRTAWISLVDLALPSLPALDLEHHAPQVGAGDAAAENEQTREAFATEAAAVAARHRRIVWRAPSRDEDAAQPVLREEVPTILANDGDGAPADGTAAATIQGGRERGTILHKLLEEVLTGETAETRPILAARAEELIRALGLPVMEGSRAGAGPSRARRLHSPCPVVARDRRPQAETRAGVPGLRLNRDRHARGSDGRHRRCHRLRSRRHARCRDRLEDRRGPFARDPRSLPRPGPDLPRHDQR